jgi:hypothetical protein
MHAMLPLLPPMPGSSDPLPTFATQLFNLSINPKPYTHSPVPLLGLLQNPKPYTLPSHTLLCLLHNPKS